ncbi:MAG: hypothetical protein KDD51_15015 [Bdellovibrionales bacterium]|nr:hypothetical protein [Bdellovibrionales bacterium]
MGRDLWMPKSFDPTKGPLPYALHFSCYCALSLLICRLSRYAAWWISLFVLHAGVTELIQASIPGREANLADFATNLAGISFGWWLAVRFRRFPTPK